MKRLAPLVLARLALAAAIGTPARASSTIPVTRCKEQNGFPPPYQPPPRTITTNVPVGLQLGAYGISSTVILAPKGWPCDGGVSANGSVSISVHNPKSGIFASGNAYEPEEAVTASIPSAGTNGPRFLACTFFAEAAYEIRQQGLECNGDAMPLGEQDSRAGVHLYTFEDPPAVHGNGNPSGGKNPANGVVVWCSAIDNHGFVTAVTATCTLPEKRHSVCTAILNDFLRRWNHH